MKDVISERGLIKIATLGSGMRECPREIRARRQPASRSTPHLAERSRRIKESALCLCATEAHSPRRACSRASSGPQHPSQRPAIAVLICSADKWNVWNLIAFHNSAIYAGRAAIVIVFHASVDQNYVIVSSLGNAGESTRPYTTAASLSEPGHTKCTDKRLEHVPIQSHKRVRIPNLPISWRKFSI